MVYNNSYSWSHQQFCHFHSKKKKNQTKKNLERTVKEADMITATGYTKIQIYSSSTIMLLLYNLIKSYYKREMWHPHTLKPLSHMESIPDMFPTWSHVWIGAGIEICPCQFPTLTTSCIAGKVPGWLCCEWKQYHCRNKHVKGYRCQRCFHVKPTNQSQDSWWRIWIRDLFTFDLPKLSRVICVSNLLNIKYMTGTLAPNKNNSSFTMFLKITRDVFCRLHVHLALPHLVFLLSFMAVGIRKCCITAIC